MIYHYPVFVIFIVGALFGKTLSKMSHTHDAYLDSDKKFHLTWKYNETHIEVLVTVKTLGWFAFGLSPDGGMDSSDVMVCWVNDSTGEAIVQVSCARSFNAFEQSRKTEFPLIKSQYEC